MASQKIVENLEEREVEEGPVVREPEPPLLGACQNPMLIDVILSNLFEFLDFKELGKCRRVSKQWFKVSLPAWLTKAPEIKLHLSPNIMPERYRSEGVHTTVNAFFQLLVHNEFHLDHWNMREYEGGGPYDYAGLRQHKRFALTGSADEPVEHQALQRFLRICGGAITELTLELKGGTLAFPIYQAVLLSTLTPNLVKLRIGSRVNFPAEDLVEPRCYVIMEESPQLKLTSLQIDDFGNPLDDWSRLPVAGWIQLLKRYPNLKTLILRKKETEARSSESAVKMLEAIANINQSDQKKSLDLRSLEMALPSADRVIPSLVPLFRKARLSLETIGLSLGQNAPVQTVAELLACQAASLKKVSIFKESPIAGDFQPPELAFLESLELIGSPLPHVSSLKNFQNLQSLFLAYPPLRSRQDVLRKLLSGPEEGLILPTLSKLHCDYGRRHILWDPLSAEDVRKLARIFPSMKDLQLWPNNLTLRTVFQSWPGLQRLTIIGNMVDDDGISRMVSDLPRMQDLTYLTMKHFDPTFQNNVGPTRITTKSLVKFLGLPNLETLQITLDPRQVYPDPQILRTVEEGIKTFKLTLAIKLEIWDWGPDIDEDEDLDLFFE